MKEHPILMSTENVKAILEGRKAQTRRVIKPQPSGIILIWESCPYGQVGDRLWCKETWAVNKTWDCFKPSAIPSGESVYYPDGGDPEDEIAKPYWVGRKQNKLFMPRWASRITLEITGIRVERLQEISEGDAQDEGVTYYDDNAVDVFMELWDSLNPKYPWESNPWVWVVSFKRVA